MDQYNSTSISVLLLDTVTGNTVQEYREFSRHWWCKGNGSCDCNRIDVLDNIEPPEEEDEGLFLCIGAKRFLALRSDPPTPYREMNQNYPTELVDRFDIPEHLPLEQVISFEFDDPKMRGAYLDWCVDVGWTEKAAQLRLMLV